MDPAETVSLDTVELMTRGLTGEVWQRMARWLGKFKTFIMQREGKPLLADIMRARIASNALALDFLTAVELEDLGRTRPAAAAGAVEFIRKVMSLPLLSADPRVGILKKAVLRSHPHIPKGAYPIHEIMVLAIADTWGTSKDWWRRMVATIILLTFLALLRGAGILSVPMKGTVWLRGLQEWLDPSVIPVDHTGVLLILPKRKSSQDRPSSVPVKAGKATRMLADHLRFVRSMAPANDFLFPARKQVFRGRKRKWVPNPDNAMSSDSLIKLIRRALCEVCGLSAEQAAAFTIHALRVGGINMYRRLGISTSMRAQMADHASLETSRRYLRLLPAEQIRRLDMMVL